MSERARAEAERWGWEAATTNLREVHYLQAVKNHRARQKDVQTLRQKLKRYRDTMVKGLFADLFAFFGDRQAEATSEALEEEEWKLYDDIGLLEKKPTTRQLFGWLSSRASPRCASRPSCSSRGASCRRCSASWRARCASLSTT